jgi:hypothetical protein
LFGITVIVMLSIVVGRVGFGVSQALVSRYVPMGALFAATTLLLVCDTLLRSRPSLRTAFIACVFFLTLPVWYANYHAVTVKKTLYTRLSAYRDCVLAHRDSPESCDSGRYAYPDQKTLARRVKLLRDRRLSFFAQTP